MGVKDSSRLRHQQRLIFKFVVTTDVECAIILMLQVSLKEFPMTRLVMRLLGGFRVELGGEPVYDFETDKA